VAGRAAGDSEDIEIKQIYFQDMFFLRYLYARPFCKNKVVRLDSYFVSSNLNICLGTCVDSRVK
jgi:hypothetical protein